MKRQRLIARTALSLLVLAWSGTAFAGAVRQNNVYINTSTMTAFGTAIAARNAANTVERIQCEVYAYTTGGANVSCIAVNSANVFKQCSSSSPGIIDAAQSISDYSHIYFTWNASGVCTFLSVTTSSQDLP